MIKKIAISELRVGMYIHDLDCKWMDHPFVSNRFLVRNNEIASKIASSGIQDFYIDTAKGKDVETAKPQSQSVVESKFDDEMKSVTLKDRTQLPSVSVTEEVDRARSLYKGATSIVHDMMKEARMGKQVNVQALEPMAENIIKIEPTANTPATIIGIAT